MNHNFSKFSLNEEFLKFSRRGRIFDWALFDISTEEQQEKVGGGGKLNKSLQSKSLRWSRQVERELWPPWLSLARTQHGREQQVTSLPARNAILVWRFSTFLSNPSQTEHSPVFTLGHYTGEKLVENFCKKNFLYCITTSLYSRECSQHF